MPNVINRIQRQPAWIALVIVIALTVWVSSGAFSSDDAPAKAANETLIPKVQVSSMRAEQVEREITLYGRTEPDRMATLRAELSGRVMQVTVHEGQAVKQGDLLVVLNQQDLPERLVSAKALVTQREQELSAAQKLGDQGYQSQVNLSQAKANLAAAQAQQQALQLALKNTRILAPFDGVLNRRMVEVGDYLRDGDAIAEVVDLDPLVIRAAATETQVQSLNVGQQAYGRMASGQDLNGEIRYLSSVSEAGTNTFALEVAVPNPRREWRAGISTELHIPLAQTWAIKLTPALLSLDDAGNIGIKTVVGETVKFTPIDMVKSTDQAVWLAGLGQQADVITLGQGFVRDGDPVEVVRAP